MLDGPHTWEAQKTAMEALLQFEPMGELTLKQENSRLTAVQEQYWSARAEWYAKSGKQPPTRQEILSFGREKVPRFRGR